MIRSLKAQNPAAVVWVLCLSEQCHRAMSEIGEPAVRLLRIPDLEAAYPALADARSNRTLIEFYFTCTPSLVCFVLDRVSPDDVVTYVDGDLYFFSDPHPLFEELGDGAVSIIPHRFPPKLQYLEKYGLYNVGWMSFRNDSRGRAIATWWQERCNEWCYDVLDGDRFADQKYLDRIATDFPGVVVIRNPGANLAPWNLGGHRLSSKGDALIVDETWPLIFFHFHGLRRVGRRTYIPGHFRYRAPFGGLIRTALYRPYIDRLEAIGEETSRYLRVPKTPLIRSASESAGWLTRIFGLLKKPTKDALAILRGEFVIAHKAHSVVPQANFAARSADAARPLRILVVHNYYGSSAPSGENNAVDAEIAMLRRAGHAVYTFTRMSDEIRDEGLWGLMHGGLTFSWNPFEVLRFRKALRHIQPHIIHVHNTFPLISPGILWASHGTAALVLTLHNYRMFCASGLLLRDGAVCTRCLDESSVRPALRYGCYRGSRVATGPVALSIALHNALGTWRRRVDAIIALTQYQFERLAATSLGSERLYVKSNFFSGSPQVVSFRDRQPVVLFVGRLSHEKGVEYLLRAWLKLGATAPRLRLVGDGPLRQSLQQMVDAHGARNVEFAGAMSRGAAFREIAASRLLIVPSITLEGFPVVLQEAFAAGTPAAVSDLGALPTIVEDGCNGLVFAARSAESIAELITRVWSDEELLMRLASAARRSHESKYTEEANYRQLMEIYERAMQRRERMLA